MSRHKFSDADLILLLQKWEQEHGESPSRDCWDADVNTPCSSGLFRQRFSSWGNALRLAGMEPKKPTISPQCRNATRKAHQGKQSCAWKGGRIKENGYILIWNPEHPNAISGRGKAYVAEHRMIMSNHIGRPLRRDETVHHKNGNREDNSLDNLELWSTNHPAGQRVEEVILWAKIFLESYGFEVIGNIHEGVKQDAVQE